MNKKKYIINALIQDTILQNNEEKNIMIRKNNGKIFLLHGPPGVGKTLTAEIFAEYHKIPLYNLNIGSLGIYSSGFEEKIIEIFNLCSRWKVILLLDEADVFMEKRSKNNIKTNIIVSILLKYIESYNGIIFLPSNRFDSIDDAFYSRITLSMLYSSLDDNARYNILKQILNNYENTLTDSEIKDLSKYLLNGRQINTIIKSANSIAKQQKSPIRKDYLLIFINYIEEFNKIIAL